MRKQIRLTEVLDAAAFAANSSHYKCTLGIVTAYYPGGHGMGPPSVDVQVAIHDVRLDPDTGARESEPWPILPKVPIAFPKFGGYVICGPMIAGDKVLLLSPDLDPTKHRFTGNAEDPIDTRRNGGAYWLAIPADITDPGAVTDPGQSLVVGQPNGVQVAISSAGVNIGANAPTDAASLASIVDKFIQTVMGWTPVPNDGGAALKLALTNALFTPTTTTASKTVKITP